MVRLAEWPRSPYLNDELREWVRLHLESLGVEDVAVYAVAGREDDQRRILVVTEVGLLDGWYAPRGSTARFSLNVRLYPWQAVRGVDLRGETYRLWAHEHQSRWRLRLARPAFDALAESPELGRALTQFAAACSVMAEPSGPQDVSGDAVAPRPGLRPAAEEPAFAAPPETGHDGDAREPAGAPALTKVDHRPGAQPWEETNTAPASASPASTGTSAPLPQQLSQPRPPIRLEPDLVGEPGPEEGIGADLARRLGLRQD